jgi:hypothetical protein
MEESMAITKEEYEYLSQRDLWLTALERAGIDDWEGCEDALELYKELEKQGSDFRFRVQ